MKTYLVKRNDNWVIEGRTHAPHDAEFYPAPPNEDPVWLDIIDIKESYTEQVPILYGPNVPVLDAEGNPVLDDDGDPTFYIEGSETGEFEEVVHETVVGKEAVVNEALKAQVLAERESSRLASEQEQQLRSIVKNAISFGSQLMEDFVIENIVMGITQDNMSESVLDAMAGVESALRTGTLHVAIKRLKEIAPEQKDAKYITDARLLDAVNKLEEYLGMPLSADLNLP